MTQELLRQLAEAGLRALPPKRLDPARPAAAEGRDVLTVDADENPNHGIALGVGDEATYGLSRPGEAMLRPTVRPWPSPWRWSRASPRRRASGEVVQVRKLDHFRRG